MKNPIVFVVTTIFKMQFIVYYIMAYASHINRVYFQSPDFVSERAIIQIKIDKLIGFNNRINLNLTLSNAHNDPVELTAHSLFISFFLILDSPISFTKHMAIACNRVSAVFSISCINDFDLKHTRSFLLAQQIKRNWKRTKTKKAKEKITSTF